jgi:hypothetical protein
MITSSRSVAADDSPHANWLFGARMHVALGRCPATTPAPAHPIRVGNVTYITGRRLSIQCQNIEHSVPRRRPARHRPADSRPRLWPRGDLVSGSSRDGTGRPTRCRACGHCWLIQASLWPAGMLIWWSLSASMAPDFGTGCGRTAPHCTDRGWAGTASRGWGRARQAPVDDIPAAQCTSRIRQQCPCGDGGTWCRAVAEWHWPAESLPCLWPRGRAPAKSCFRRSDGDSVRFALATGAASDRERRRAPLHLPNNPPQWRISRFSQDNLEVRSDQRLCDHDTVFGDHDPTLRHAGAHREIGVGAQVPPLCRGLAATGGTRCRAGRGAAPWCPVVAPAPHPAGTTRSRTGCWSRRRSSHRRPWLPEGRHRAWPWLPLGRRVCDQLAGHISGATDASTAWRGSNTETFACGQTVAEVLFQSPMFDTATGPHGSLAAPLLASAR